MIDFLFSKTPLSYFVQSIWRDEAFSYLLAKQNLIKILSLTAKDFNPPLYYLLLHLWIKIFGSSEIALRTPSLIFFWATVYLAFLLMIEVFKYPQKKAFFYLLFFLVNPLLNYFAFEARMYMMFCFFATLSFYSFLTKQKKLYFWSTLLGLFTHYFMITVIFTQLFVYFISKNKPPFKLKELISPSLFFLPWLIFVIFTKKPLTGSFWIKKLTLNKIFLIPASLFTGYEFDFNFYDKRIHWFSWFTLILVVITILRKKQKKEIFLFNFLIIWSFLVPILIGLISIWFPIFLPRYLIFAGVGLILLIVYLIEKLPFFLKSLAIIFVFFLSINYTNYQLRYRKKEEIRKTIGEIKRIAKKEDLLYVTDVLYYHPAVYYFGEDRVFIYQKNYEEIPDYVGKVLIPKEKIINHLPIFPKKAFILNSASDYQIQSSL